jgi:2-polyprenyl-6-methoxyphenol hydroxylase-like FAD-dependent oxidoreductase
MNTSVLIVGAGPVGLTLACELTRYRIPVRIVDKAAQRTDKSNAIVIWSRTLELEEIQTIVDRRGPKGVSLFDPIWLSGFRINSRKGASYRSGRVFLSGDAAHVHSPAGGEGMNTGMQDACHQRDVRRSAARHLQSRAKRRRRRGAEEHRTPDRHRHLAQSDRGGAAQYRRAAWRSDWRPSSTLSPTRCRRCRSATRKAR